MGAFALPAAKGIGSAVAAGVSGSRGKSGNQEIDANTQLVNQLVAQSKQQQAFGREEFVRGRPLRQGVTGVLTDFLNTRQTPSFLDLSPTVKPLAALSLPGLEAERNLLRRRLLAGGARGGQLSGQLAQADIAGALQRSQLAQQDLLRQEARDVDRLGIRRQLFGAAGDFGTGAAALGFQGLNAGAQSTANALQGQLGLANLTSQRQMAASQGAGQLLGQGLGKAKLGLPSSVLKGSIGGSIVGV